MEVYSITGQTLAMILRILEQAELQSFFFGKALKALSSHKLIDLLLHASAI
jgi:hypothetical protein